MGLLIFLSLKSIHIINQFPGNKRQQNLNILFLIGQKRITLLEEQVYFLQFHNKILAKINFLK